MADVLERLNALLRRAAHPSTPEEEARTSALLAARMIALHRVHLSLVPPGAPPPEDVRERGRATRPYRRRPDAYDGYDAATGYEHGRSTGYSGGPCPGRWSGRTYTCMCNPVDGHHPSCWRFGQSPPDCPPGCHPRTGHVPSCTHYPGSWF